MKNLKHLIVGFACVLGTASFAYEQSVLVPTPAPTPAAEVESLPAPTPALAPAPLLETPATVADPTPVLAPAVCPKSYTAVSYTVLQLVNECGQRVKDSGLIGHIARKRCTTREVPVGRVVASVCTKETSNTPDALRNIRSARRACAACSVEDVRNRIEDLASSSHRVRVAAEVSLKRCGFRVVTESVCVSYLPPVVEIY